MMCLSNLQVIYKVIHPSIHPLIQPTIHSLTRSASIATLREINVDTLAIIVIAWSR